MTVEARGPIEGGGKLGPFREDFFQRVVNVEWGGALGFLFIGADGVFISKNGGKWGKIAKGFSANAVAYGKNVWVAATDGGMKLSEDKGKTWKSGGGPSHCENIIYAGPGFEHKNNSSDEKGAFYAIDPNGGDNGIVYASTDGVSWSEALKPPADVRDNEPGIIGNTVTQIGNQGSLAIALGDQSVKVETTADQSGTYTVAVKWVGENGGSLSGPSQYSPTGNASTHNDQESYAGTGAAGDYLSYIGVKETHFGTATDLIVVLGGATITSDWGVSEGGPFFGQRLSGGIYMGAAGGQAWMHVQKLASDITYFIASATTGTMVHLAGPVAIPSKVFKGQTCGLAMKNKSPVFCTVLHVNGIGGLWTNVSGSWINTFNTAGGAVGVGKIQLVPSPASS